jgi:putative ABC transport system substrate-binding protein
MNRREFITLLGGTTATWPLAARAQQSERMRRIGILFGGFSATDPEPQMRVAVFRHLMEQLGWTEGRDLQIDLRIGAGDPERVRAYATELVDLAPDVIVANSTPALAALQKVTRSIPIVFVIVADPVAGGFVASLSQPGGNSTGFTQVELTVGGKWLQLLKEIAPAVGHVAVILDPAQPTAPEFLGVIDEAAASFGIRLTKAMVQDPAGIERLVVEAGREPGGGLIVTPSTVASANRELVVQLTARYRLPAIYPNSYFPALGGLMSYGADGVDLWRRCVPYVDLILRGAKPADLPVQTPTKFETVLNLKTAKALGLTVPPTLRALADEVFE